jgi:hypothetical protein
MTPYGYFRDSLFSLFSRWAAGTGGPAAHKEICLLLLPSGPDKVHRTLLRRTCPCSPSKKQSTETSSFIKIKAAGRGEITWRRVRDSNPRYGFPYTRFPGVLLQPLGQLSKVELLDVSCSILYSLKKHCEV